MSSNDSPTDPVRGDPLEDPSPVNPQPYVHPDTARLFAVAPCFKKIPLFGTAVVPFGPKCVTALGAIYILSKGLSKTLLSSSQYAMFMKKYQVEVAVYQRYTGISSMGFAIKPVTAILSDTFALFGYTKRWYQVAACLLGAVCAIIYGTLPFKESSAPAAAGVIFVGAFCIASIDVLSQGHYSRLIKRHPVPGADLISWVWAFIMIGNIAASAIQGPLSDSGKPTIGIFLSAGLQAISVVFFIFNWYGEKTNSVERQEDFEFLMKELKEEEEKGVSGKEAAIAYPEEVLGTDPVADNSPNSNEMELVGLPIDDEDEIYEPRITRCCGPVWEVNTEAITRNVFVVFYGMVLTMGVVVLTILTIVGDVYQLLYGCVVVSAVLCGLGFICIPVTIMKANLYGWAQLVSYILITGATDNFYMAGPDCVENGPHFTQTFYYTVGAVIGNVAGLGGVYLFARVFSKQSYRVTLICTTLVQVLASLFDIIMVERWNIYIGIPDHAMYIMGDAVVYQVCYMLNYMPTNMLVARLCPKGCESTMFAILASFWNLGASTASTIGAILMETVWPVNATPGQCDFSNLRWLIITGHLLTPLIAIPLVFVLIPGTRICDPIDPKEVEALSFAQKWLLAYRQWRREADGVGESDSISGQELTQ